jgi:RNA polymerase sigma factor (sigma-70 family)
MLALENKRVPPTNETEGDYVASNIARAAQIFSEYGDFIRSIIRFRTGDEDLTDDLFQDYFLSLVSRPIPQDVQNIKSYIYRAITNDTFDAVRRVEKYRGKIERYAKKIENSVNKNHPENALIEVEETARMFRMIERLISPTESQAVTLKFKNNGSIEEVAKQMAVNKRSVSRYISVGLRKLRQFLVEKKDM